MQLKTGCDIWGWVCDAITNQVLINIATLLLTLGTLITAFIALKVSSQSGLLAQKAMSLAQFNNRYKVYCMVKKIISEIENSSNLNPLLHKIELLYPKANYLFQNDIMNLLESLREKISKANSSNGFIDVRKLNQLKSDIKAIQLESHFNQYLYDPDFKKPIIK